MYVDNLKIEYCGEFETDDEITMENEESKSGNQDKVPTPSFGFTTEKDEVLVNVYPNPTSDYLNIALPQDIQLPELSAIIYTVNGLVVKEDKGTAKLSITELKSGIYLVMLYAGGNQLSTHRIVKL